MSPLTSPKSCGSAAKWCGGNFPRAFGASSNVSINHRRLSSVNLQPRGTGEVRGGLRQFLVEIFRTDVAYFGVVRAWQEAALADAGLGEMQRAIESWTGARILRVFQLLQQHPDARPGRDLPAFARMMDRHFWSLLARGSRLSPREFQREVEVAAEVIDHYLCRDPVSGV